MLPRSGRGGGKASHLTSGQSQVLRSAIVFLVHRIEFYVAGIWTRIRVVPRALPLPEALTFQLGHDVLVSPVQTLLCADALINLSVGAERDGRRHRDTIPGSSLCFRGRGCKAVDGWEGTVAKPVSAIMATKVDARSHGEVETYESSNHDISLRKAASSHSLCAWEAFMLKSAQASSRVAT